ncbi:MAG: NAD-dependent epimerase/dehydratase family protein [Thermoplasmata archaeon]|nr:NAD-dependent epimerase/dehydratase family protein [Thermoplasmata archaeon]
MKEEPPVAESSRAGGRAKRVLVAGASGFLGRAVVRALSAANYEVRGLVRDSAKADRVREAGAIPVRGDVLDLPSLKDAAAGCSALVHLAANPSGGEAPAVVRVVGAENLVQAARSERVPRLLIGSGYWVYADQPGSITEESPTDPRGESRVNFDTEQVGLAANAAGELDILILRPAMVYGNGSWFRGMAESIRSGGYSVIGDGANRWSLVELSDAAAAFRTVLEAGRAGAIYNVADGHPAPLREFVDFVAAQIGATPPMTIDPSAAEAEYGEDIAHHLAATRAVGPQQLLGLGWVPRFPTYREGIPGVLRDMFPRGHSGHG